MRWLARAAGLVLLATAGAQASPPAARLGVITVGDDEDVRAAALAFFGARRDAGLDTDSDVSREAADVSRIGERIEEMRVEGADLVVVFGEAASLRARTPRDRPVVFASADGAFASDVAPSGNACVATGVDADAVAASLRAVAPTLRRVGVLAPAGDEAAHENADELARHAEVLVAEPDAATPGARAAQALVKLRPAASLVWLPPSISDADAAALADALQGSGVPLIGSRTAHFRAGCAVAVRSDPQSIGALAATLAKEILGGADPVKLGVRRARRRLVEVNLAAARRLAFDPPLTLLAWADTIVRPRAVQR
jgi:ABC-type uncharacterized transport system substrate-binding protein